MIIASGAFPNTIKSFVNFILLSAPLSWALEICILSLLLLPSVYISEVLINNLHSLEIPMRLGLANCYQIQPFHSIERRRSVNYHPRWGVVAQI